MGASSPLTLMHGRWSARNRGWRDAVAVGTAHALRPGQLSLRWPSSRRDADFAPVDGVLLDLGLSSDQLADRARGFSFQLRMRHWICASTRRMASRRRTW